MPFEDGTAVVFVVDAMISQNCSWMMLGDRSWGSETRQTTTISKWKKQKQKQNILLIDFWNLFSGEYLDILAISCDSFNEEVNVLIGRGQGRKNHVENLHKLRQWCRDYAVAFKINSVINRFNVEEDMNEQIKALNPVRWKVRK